MFSLLSPVSLWLGALLAIPLVIHFLGRQRLRKEPFPSLMLIEERLARSMQRHRLKNLLLLLIRTLLVLCLLIALGNPALETQAEGRAASAEAVAVLLQNGAYGLLPDPAVPGRSALEAQRHRIRALDSAAGAAVGVVPLIPDGPGVTEASSRFGEAREAVERLLAALDAGAPTAQAYLPVFAWEDLAPVRDDLARALKERPGLQLVFWDHGGEGARLNAFAGVRALPSPRAPTVDLRALLNPEAAKAGDGKVRAWIGERIFQEAGAGEALAEFSLPLSEGARTAGRLSVEAPGFAVRDWHFCFPNPGRMVLAHAGSALASLPSLGRENYHRRIVHVAAAKDLPLDGSLRLVFLSNERNTDAAAYGRLVEFVRRGGRLIVGVGRDSDIPLVNRFLLQPLRMGRLGSLAEMPQGGRAEADPKALASLGGLPPESGQPGQLGLVRKRFAFVPDSGTAILIRQGGEPVLAERDFQKGRVLLWTTDLDDLEWSDLGVAPLVPLIHQAFQEGAGGMTANVAVDSDSLLRLDLKEPGARVEARDPEGRPFTRLRAEGGRLRLGPFDKLGLHRVSFGSDSAVFAVNLAPRGPMPAQEAGDWEKWNAASREGFLAALAPFKDRVIVSSPAGDGMVRASARPLWKAFFLAAILLLFLEGLIAAAYSPGSRSRAGQSA